MKTLLLTLVSLCSAAAAERVEVSLSSEESVSMRLKAGEVSMRMRQAAIVKLFKEVGCEAELQKVFAKSANVICTLPGDNSSPVIVGAHYDFVTQGEGIVDDWSGTALLPSLFEALKTKPRHHTMVFVAFAGEEEGLLGSRNYVSKLTKDQRKSVRAFVNLECLGMTATKVWQSRANAELLKRLDELSRAVNMTIQGVNVDAVGNDDSDSFLSAHIPVLTLHSTIPENLSILHSNKDTLRAINQDFYYQAYKLAAYYLAYLDLKLE